jgi:hypothetical protein
MGVDAEVRTPRSPARVLAPYSLSVANESEPLPACLSYLRGFAIEVDVPDRDSCNLLTLVATMIVNSVQALLSARDRFHPL